MIQRPRAENPVIDGEHSLIFATPAPLIDSCGAQNSTRPAAGSHPMKHWLAIACAAALTALAFARDAHAGKSEYDAMIATHARANHVPEALVHRVIVRESKYQPQLVGQGGTIGLMQIKLATAKGLGYTGDAEGLRDPNTNLTYGVKYLAGAYRAADGDHERTMHFYAAGYYDAAKRLRLELAEGKRLEADGNPQPPMTGDAARKTREKAAVVARARVPLPLSILPTARASRTRRGMQ
jgi:soluble lytic murein transglycosylase-like protein